MKTNSKDIDKIEAEFMDDPTTRKNWSFVRSNLKGSVLDVGCGNGLVTHVHDATIGLDIIFNIDCFIPFVRGDVHHLPFSSDAFDVVIFNHSLEHSPNPYLALQEGYRVLRENGKILIISPNARNFLWPLYLTMHGYIYCKDHASFFTYDLLEKLAAGVGFKNIKTSSSLLVPRIPIIWIRRIFQKKIIVKIAALLSENYPNRLSCDVIATGRKQTQNAIRTGSRIVLCWNA